MRYGIVILKTSQSDEVRRALKVAVPHLMKVSLEFEVAEEIDPEFSEIYFESDSDMVTYQEADVLRAFALGFMSGREVPGVERDRLLAVVSKMYGKVTAQKLASGENT